MDQNEEETPNLDTKTALAIAAVVMVTGFGAYQLGKLGVEWAAEGVRFAKEKKKKK